jgi:ubiquinone/menaquinone biosynthesis C-methylase UbiE
MGTVKRWLGGQAVSPARLGAGLMLLAGPSSCHHREIAELLDLEPDDVLLDVGCGSGLFLRKYAAGVRRIAALDHSESQIRLARRVLGARLADGTAEVVTGDAASLPWPDGTFTVVACNSLSCIMRAEVAVAENLRVLRPGGRVVMATEHYPDTDAARRFEREWGWRAWTDPELRRVLEDAGFVQIALVVRGGTVFATARTPSGGA